MRPTDVEKEYLKWGYLVGFTKKGSFSMEKDLLAIITTQCE